MKTGKQILETAIIPMQPWAKKQGNVFSAMIGDDIIETDRNKRGFTTQQEAIDYAKGIKDLVLSKIM